MFAHVLAFSEVLGRCVPSGLSCTGSAAVEDQPADRGRGDQLTAPPLEQSHPTLHPHPLQNTAEDISAKEQAYEQQLGIPNWGFPWGLLF